MLFWYVDFYTLLLYLFALYFLLLIFLILKLGFFLRRVRLNWLLDYVLHLHLQRILFRIIKHYLILFFYSIAILTYFIVLIYWQYFYFFIFLFIIFICICIICWWENQSIFFDLFFWRIEWRLFNLFNLFFRDKNEIFWN